MNKPPCIRGLRRYQKSGCPEKFWDGEDGCPCWIELAAPRRDNPQKKVVEKKCLDIWSFEFLWASLGYLEGNQQATESFRNNMTVEGSPKADPASAELLLLFKKLQEKQRIIFEHESQKAIEKDSTDGSGEIEV